MSKCSQLFILFQAFCLLPYEFRVGLPVIYSGFHQPVVKAEESILATGVPWVKIIVDIKTFRENTLLFPLLVP